MTKADVQYLKHRTITNTFVLNQNKQIPKDPNLPEYQKDAMDEFFEDVFRSVEQPKITRNIQA